MTKEKHTLNQICKMIASGEIPKGVYDKYLSDEPIGFMTSLEIMNYLLQGEQVDEKQIPKKPIEEYYADPIYDDEGCQVGAIFIYKAICPSCNNILCFGEVDKSDLEDIVFCDGCGQAIDLKESDEE